jgi:hypothetical protein
MPAILGGLFIGVLTALPIVNCCCCLWMVGGGFLAAYLESQRQPTSLSILQGARIGLMAGVVGAVVWLLVSTALSPLNVRFLELAGNAPDMPPEIRDMIETMKGSGRDGDAFAVAGKVVSFVVTLCVISIISTIGGMTGAAYFKKDVPPALGGPINPPPIP